MRAGCLRTRFHYFLLELEVLVHILRIVLSGDDAPEIVPDKSLGNGRIQNGCNRKFVDVTLTFCLASL
jgi:hypothetical protein